MQRLERKGETQTDRATRSLAKEIVLTRRTLSTWAAFDMQCIGCSNKMCSNIKQMNRRYVRMNVKYVNDHSTRLQVAGKSRGTRLRHATDDKLYTKL
jgi:hypothetical protein